MSDRVIVEITDGIAHVRLNRPDKRNALDGEMFQAIADAGEQLKSDAELRAVVLSGEGKSFCAGLDLAMFEPARSGRRGRRIQGRSNRAASPISASRSPGCGRSCPSR